MIVKSTDTYRCDFCSAEVTTEQEQAHAFGGGGSKFPDGWSQVAVQMPSEKVVKDAQTQAVIDGITKVSQQGGLGSELAEAEMNHLTRMLPPFHCQLEICPDCMDDGADIWPIVGRMFKEATEYTQKVQQASRPHLRPV